MLRRLFLALMLVAAIASGVSGAQPAAGQMTAFKMREDFGSEPLSDCYLQYYYYIPCPTYSWFWGFTGFIPGDILGVFFEVGDISTGTGLACDPQVCHRLETLRMLDLVGYGSIYPGYWTVRIDIYCADELGCPVGPPLWTSSPLDFGFGWNYIDVSPPLCLTPCSTVQDPTPSAPRVVITAEHLGPQAGYPVWGWDNISAPLEEGCAMHDQGCLPALYPRPAVSHYQGVHSGYYGYDGDPHGYCPSWRILDAHDTTGDGSQFGYIELAWRIYLSCAGATSAKPSTWGSIKSIYR